MPPPDTDASATILGAGIVGLCTALSLLERGARVQIIDRGEPGQETSMGNAGVVSPWSIVPQSLPGLWKKIPGQLLFHGRPLSIHPKVAARMIPWGWRFLQQGREAHVRRVSEAMSRICGPSIELYQRHLLGTGHEGLLRESSYIHAFRDGSRANLTDLGYRIRLEKGADVELVGRGGLAEIEPELSEGFAAAVVIKGQARVRSPGRLGRVLADKARRLGAKFMQADVTGIQRKDSGWEIRCAGGTLEADRLVVCLGAWSPGFLEWTNLNVPLMAERGYHVEFSEPGIEIYNSVMDVDAKVVASSMEGGVRIAGLAEFAPIDAPPDARRKARLVQVAKAAFHGLQTDRPSFWMGRRPSFPDSLPMLGDVSGHQGLFLNFGHAHYGLMMAPKSGELIAEMICGEEASHKINDFSPSRFCR
ncbi:MAG: FAD-binding oxidoreductase [Boseongicola sp. SB0670_bin_30]|nr:FAD-binding oxidoreductase [Boseongicola sp. SB0670_bin_30]